MVGVRVAQHHKVDPRDAHRAKLGHQCKSADGAIVAAVTTPVDHHDGAVREPEDRCIAVPDIDEGRVDVPMRRT